MRPSRSPLYQIVGATVLLLVAGIIFIPAYLYWNHSIQRSVAPLPDCGAAPRFESSDQLGRSIGTKELSGTIWVAGLIKNAKPGEAEEFCSKCAELDQNFGAAKVITLITFFVGADKNQVEDYARRYEASDRWRFIPISEGDSSTLVQDWGSAGAGCRREMQGQSLFLLIDQRGEIREVYDASAPELVQSILFDAGNLLRAEHLAP
ncbi:MAG: hypothetical protein JO025_04890 [Verrucomicrobia bacterium]|nr:hypothetical protein [Verrucomicrobiota bacterium]